MLNSFFKIALRNLGKRFSYSLINILGLSFGLAACLFIYTFVKQELSYDQFNSKSDRIFRVTREFNMGGGASAYAAVNYSLGDLITQNVPEVESMTRIGKVRGWISTSDKVKRFEEDRFLLAEPSFFDLFDVVFLSGNAQTALEGPNKIVVSKATATKYFGEEDPMGKRLTLDFKREFIVSGVIKNWPSNSHIQFDFLGSMETAKTNWYSDDMFNHWGNIWAYTYILTNGQVSQSQIEGQVDKTAYEFGPPILGNFDAKFPCQPLTDIYLNSDLNGELGVGGSFTFLKVFIAVGLLILLIACFNFINLSTARASWRAKEVGMKKILGVEKKILIGQFLGESILITFFSALLAMLLVAILLPFFNGFSGKTLAYEMLFSADLILFFLGVLLVVGLSAGSFPAFYLSSFKPVMVLKGNSKIGDSKIAGRLRKSLVVMQFVISMCLVVASITVYYQLDFARNVSLGMDKEHVIVVDFYNQELGDKLNVIQEEYSGLSNVVELSATSDTPPRNLNSWWMQEKGNPEAKKELISVIAVDYNFVETMNIRVVDGRSFDEEFSQDVNAIVVNQAMVNFMGLKEPVGTVFDMSEGQKDVAIVGVVENFHFSSIHEKIKPIMLHVRPDWYDHLLVKVAPGNYESTLKSLRSSWESLIPDWQFSYHFLDEDFNRAYQNEERLSNLVMIFSGLAVFIGVLGLLGLANYTAEQKMKEIGIRKVLGASLKQVVWIQYNSFVTLSLLAFVVSVPISYFFLNDWLSQFAYRIDLSWWIFLVGGILTLFVSLGTVSFQSVKAGLRNPIDTLRSE